MNWKGPTVVSRAVVASVVLTTLLAWSTLAEPPKPSSPLTLPEPPVRVANAADLSRACIDCHTEITELLKGDKHIAKDFHCVICHGKSE